MAKEVEQLAAVRVSATTALANLLIDKGVIDVDEYTSLLKRAMKG